MTISPARKLAIAQRRQQVARLYLQGQGQTEIALELEMGQSTVSKDLHHIHTAWRESAIRDFDALRDLEIARLKPHRARSLGRLRAHSKEADSGLVKRTEAALS